MIASLPPIGFIPTRNAEAARAFYEGILGLQFESDDNFAMVFRLHGDIMLRVVRVGDFQAAQFTIFGWESAAIASDVDALTAKGLEFLRFGFLEQDAGGVWTAPSGSKVAWFNDPDGNVLSLSQH